MERKSVVVRLCQQFVTDRTCINLPSAIALDRVKEMNEALIESETKADCLLNSYREG